MNLNIILVVLGAALAVQATPAQPHLEASVDVKNLTVTVYNAALKVANDIVENAVNALDSFGKSKEAFDAKVTEILVKLSTSFVDSQFRLLESFANKTNASGKIIIECLALRHNTSDAVIRRIFTDYGTCLEKDSFVIDVVKGILGQFKGFIAEIQKEVDSLKKCRNFEAVCLTLFQAKQAVTFAKITAAVVADQVKLQSLGAKLAALVAGCTAPVAPQIAAGLVPYFNEFATCVFTHK